MNDSEIKFSVASRLDCCGHLCPVPILMTEEKMEDLKRGDILEVLYTDIGAKSDLQAWCRATGNTLLHSKEKSGTGYAYIRKAGILK